MVQEPLALVTLFVAVTGIAFWLEYSFPVMSRVGSAMLAVIMGALLSNLGFVPISSPVYDAMGGAVTLTAIAWLLLAVDLRDLKKAGPKILVAFGLAAVGTAVGALFASSIYFGLFGDDTWRLAGTLTGTYTGGSVNFVSVGRALELPERLFAGATASDNLLTGLWLAATLMIPVWFGRFFKKPDVAALPESYRVATDVDGGGAAAAAVLREDLRTKHHPFFRREEISAVDVAVLFAVGVGLVWVSGLLGELTPVIPSVLWLTTLALIVGHSPLFRNVRGAMQLGSVALHFFFVLIGILSRVSEIIAVGVEVFFFTAVVVLVHGFIVFGVGRLLKLDIGSLAVASQAAVGGPSSALAVAISKEWHHLVLPSVIVGLLGYAVGTYLGYGVGRLVQLLMGG